MTDTTQSGRPLPALTDLNRTYWTSGAAGAWRLQRCPACERLIHPPALRCQYDHAVPDRHEPYRSIFMDISSRSFSA